MKYILISTVLILFFIDTKSQGISWIIPKDSIAYPLRQNDNGILFSYFNNSYGKVGAFINFNNYIYEIFSDEEVVYGESNFNISARILKKIFSLENSNYSGKIIMSHNSFSKNKYHQKETDIYIRVNAPHGSTLYDYPTKPTLYNYPSKPNLYSYPTKPNLYRINNIKKKTSGLAILGITLGVGVTVGGIKVAIDNNSGEETSENEKNEASLLIAGGLVLFSWSCSKLHYYEDDYYLNSYNSQLNDNILEQWEMEKIDIYRYNENILEQWNVRKTGIYRLNERVLNQWNNKKNEVDRLNSLIINSVTIKITL